MQLKIFKQIGGYKMIIGNKNILASALSLKEVLLKEAVNTKYNKIILASAFLSEKAVDELKDF